MAEFTGFYFNNIHSSTYHLYRVSDGNRYEEGLIPDFEDRSISLVGTDGDLYGERRFKATSFTIRLAYDSVTEQDLHNIRNWLADEELHPFQFDERPYKTYYVKVSSRPVLDYVCFNEENEFGDKVHIYKGEGSITFTAYDPFGYCVDESKVIDIVDGAPVMKNTGLRNRQQLEFYGALNYTHRDDFIKGTFNTIIDRPQDVSIENWTSPTKRWYYIAENTKTDLELDNTVLWAPASGLLKASNLAFYNNFEPYSNKWDEQDDPKYLQCFTYNPGDRETPFSLLIDLKTQVEKTEFETLKNKTIRINYYNPQNTSSYTKQYITLISELSLERLAELETFNTLHQSDIENHLPEGTYEAWQQRIVNARVDYARYQELMSLLNKEITITLDKGEATEKKYSLIIQIDGTKETSSQLLIDTKKHLVSVWDGEKWNARYDLVKELQNHQWPLIPKGAYRLDIKGQEANNFICDIKYSYIYY